MRGLIRKIRSRVGIRSTKVSIRTHVPWYVRFGTSALLMGLAAAIAWWLVDNSYRITGFNREDAEQQIQKLSTDTARLQQELDSTKRALTERDRQVQIEKAAQTELARNVAQLQEENASLKEDLGFLRNIMSSGSVPEGLSIQNLKVEQDGEANSYRYRMLLIQGGQRKQDFKGRIQFVVRVAHSGATSQLNFPEDAQVRSTGTEVEFRYYHKVEGRFTIPEGALLKSVQARVYGAPGWELRTSKILNIS
jgi:multidrug efflux pump subunit AcrA (membrane-fusion protein)